MPTPWSERLYLRFVPELLEDWRTSTTGDILWGRATTFVMQRQPDWLVQMKRVGRYVSVGVVKARER